MRKLRTRNGAAPLAFTPDGRIVMTAFRSPVRRAVQLFDVRTNRTVTIHSAKNVFFQAAQR